MPGVSQSVVLTRLAGRTAASMPEGARGTGGVPRQRRREPPRKAWPPSRPTAPPWPCSSPPPGPTSSPPSCWPRAPATGPTRRPPSWSGPAGPTSRWCGRPSAAWPIDLRATGATMTALVLVGEALADRPAAQRSHLYEPGYTTAYRLRSPAGSTARPPLRPAQRQPGSGPLTAAGPPIAIVGFLGAETLRQGGRGGPRGPPTSCWAPAGFSRPCRQMREASRSSFRGRSTRSSIWWPSGGRSASGCACWRRGTRGSSGSSGWRRRRFGPEALEIHPAPSSVAVAFARAGIHWDDAVVVSAHGRPWRRPSRWRGARRRWPC